MTAFFAAPAAQAKSSAKLEYRVTCRDGVTARPGKGACSHHGGIDAKGKSGVLCTDGVLSDDKGKDICKGHNGVALKGAGVIGKDDDVKHVDKDLGPNSDKIVAWRSRMRLIATARCPHARCPLSCMSWSCSRV